MSVYGFGKGSHQKTFNTLLASGAPPVKGYRLLGAAYRNACGVVDYKPGTDFFSELL